MSTNLKMKSSIFEDDNDMEMLSDLNKQTNIKP